MAFSYIKTVNISTLKEMDKSLSFVKNTDNLDETIKRLKEIALTNKTACYYLAVSASDFLSDLPNEKAIEWFQKGKSQLFCDYYLLRYSYEKDKMTISISNLMQSLIPIKTALETLMKKQSEAKYIYADLLLSGMLNSGKPSTKEAIKILQALSKNGHRMARYTLAKVYLNDVEFGKKDTTASIQLLEKSVEQGFKAAADLLKLLKGEKAAEEIAIVSSDAEEEDKEAIEEKIDAVKEIDDFTNPRNHPMEFLQVLLSFEEFQDLTNKKLNTDDVSERIFALIARLENKKAAFIKYISGYVHLYSKNNYNLELAKTELYEAYRSEPLNYILYVLFYAYFISYKENKNKKKETVNDEKVLKDIALRIYRSFSSDPNILYFVYPKLKTKKDDYRNALVMLSIMEDEYPTFYILEMIDINEKLGKNVEAASYFEKLLNVNVEDEYLSKVAKLYDDYAMNENEKNIGINLYNKAANNNNAFAAYTLGRYYENGHRVKEDIEKAIGYYTQAAINGNNDAKYCLGLIYLKRNDSLKALEWFQNGAIYNHILCARALAAFYFHGKYVMQDFAEALRYYNIAAEQKDPEALRMVGVMLYNGYGLIQDKERGVEFFKEAYKYGSKEVLKELGSIKIDNNDPEGVKILSEAVSNNNNPEAANKLGDLYYNGVLVKQNFKLAYKYYEIAANARVGNAVYHIGLMYKNGLGVSINLNTAFKYFEIASGLSVMEASYEAGVCAYHLKQWETANSYLLNTLNEDRPLGYYLLASLNKNNKIKGASKENAKYYAEKAYSLGIAAAKKLIG